MPNGIGMKCSNHGTPLGTPNHMTAAEYLGRPAPSSGAGPSRYQSSTSNQPESKAPSSAASRSSFERGGK